MPLHACGQWAVALRSWQRAARLHRRGGLLSQPIAAHRSRSSAARSAVAVQRPAHEAGQEKHDLVGGVAGVGAGAGAGGGPAGVCVVDWCGA